MEVLKVSSLQSIGQPIIQAIQETLLFLLISVNFMWGIARQLSELGDVLGPKVSCAWEEASWAEPRIRPNSLRKLENLFFKTVL